MFLTESWFWRGTQSAIFYYVSCSPCLEYNHKRHRRKEAELAEKGRADIISTQPGIILQPGPFQTNPDWAEEIIRGPGPPKGWKKDKILQGYTESEREKYRSPEPTDTHLLTAERQSGERSVKASSSGSQSHGRRMDPSLEPFPSIDASGAQTSVLTTAESVARSSESAEDATTRPSTSSSEQTEQQRHTRPSMDRRLSSAVDNIKDTIKGWNLKRYEREDEILSGLNERLIKIWDRATQHTAHAGVDNKKLPFMNGRRRAGTGQTNESEGYDWQRAVRNPEINDLHPPVVSQLPANRDQAAWMLLPPPSAAVMAGRCRPQDEPALRWPLARIGRDDNEWAETKSYKDISRNGIRTRDGQNSRREKTPDLSNSSSDESWSDDEADEGAETDGPEKRHSAPVDGWIPVMPKPSAQFTHQPTSEMRDDFAW